MASTQAAARGRQRETHIPGAAPTMPPAAGTANVVAQCQACGGRADRSDAFRIRHGSRSVSIGSSAMSREGPPKVTAGHEFPWAWAALWRRSRAVCCAATPQKGLAVEQELQKITSAARLGGAWTPRELRPLVRVHPERARCPAGGHQRPGRAQQHVGHRDGLPSRDPARPHRQRHRREPHSEGERHRAGLPLLRESHWLPNWLPKPTNEKYL